MYRNRALCLKGHRHFGCSNFVLSPFTDRVSISTVRIEIGFAFSLLIDFPFQQVSEKNPFLFSSPSGSVQLFVSLQNEHRIKNEHFQVTLLLNWMVCSVCSLFYLCLEDYIGWSASFIDLSYTPVTILLHHLILNQKNKNNIFTVKSW